MRHITRLEKVEIRPSAEELAECFWAMHAGEQAEFFNHLAEIAETRLCFQLQYVTDNVCLSDEGRWAMGTIGEYARPATRAEQENSNE